MRLMVPSLCLALATVPGCSQFPAGIRTAPQPPEQAMEWPKDWSKHLGETVTLEGTAANARLGALLMAEKQDIWIDGLDSWPDSFYRGGDRGKRLRVTGTVIQRNDMPVFVEKPGEPLRSGIPVESEEEARKQKRRFLLKNAKWTILE